MNSVSGKLRTPTPWRERLLRSSIGRILAALLAIAVPFAAVAIPFNLFVSDKLLKGEFHDLKEIMGKSREQGMRTFDYSLFELYDAGVIAYDEAIRNADSANELRLNIKLNSKRTPPSNTGIYHQLS